MKTDAMTTKLQPTVQIKKRPRVGTMPSIRSKLTDLPCRKCGSRPTTLSGRSAVDLEQSCNQCGHIRFLRECRPVLPASQARTSPIVCEIRNHGNHPA